MDGISLLALVAIFFYGLTIPFVLGLVFGMIKRALYWILPKGRKK